MKIRQTGSTLTVKTNGAIQLIFGVITLLGSLALLFAFLSGGLGDDAAILGLFALIFAIVGGIVMFQAKNRTTTMVQNGAITMKEKRILGGQVESREVPASTVTAVEHGAHRHTRINRSRNGGRRMSTQRDYQLSLMLSNNDQILLATKRGGGGVIGSIRSFIKAPLSKEGEQIANFLGVPFQATSSQGGVGALRDAITGGLNGQQTPGQQPNQAPMSVSPQQPSTNAVQPSTAPSQQPMATPQPQNTGAVQPQQPAQGPAQTTQPQQPVQPNQQTTEKHSW